MSTPDTAGAAPAADDIPVLESRIQSVTVFRAFARVERVATIPVNGSVPARVRLGRLPLTLDDGSIQVRVEADDGGGAIPVAVDLRVGLETPPPPEDPPAELRDKLRDATRVLQGLRTQLGCVDEELGMIQGLSIGQRPGGRDGGAPPPSPMAARRTLLELQHERQEALVEQRRALEIAIREAEEARREIESELRQAGGNIRIHPHQLRKHIEIGLSTVGSGTPATARLVVAYLVPGVRWAPSYKLQFDRDMTRVRVAVRASVAQRTGEHWDEAQLTLSTAAAQRWTELPKLTSVRIGRKQAPPAAVGWREPPVGAEALYDDHDRTFGGPSLPEPPPPSPEPMPIDAYKDGRGLGSGDEGDGEEIDDEYEEERLRDRSVEPEAMMEAPMEDMAPSMPASAPMRSASMAGGILGGAADLLSSIAPPAKSAPAPKGQAKEKKRRARTEAFARGGGGPGSGAFGDDDDDYRDDEFELAADADLMQYGALRMGAGGLTTRGKLRITADHERYREQLPEAFRAHIATFAGILQQALQTAYDTSSQSPPPGCVPDFPEFEYDYAYPTDAPVSIPSDGAFHTIPLTTREGGVDQRYVVVPRESQDVFRFVEWKNPLDAPLLDGPADVHVGGDYLVTTQLRFVAPRGEAKLGLGVEQGIAVARNTRYHEDTSGMLGGTLNLHHHIAVEIRNNLARPALIEVRERIPVTPHGEDDITVETAAVEPEWASYDPDEYHLRGGHRWICTVAAGAVQDLEAEYVLKISSKQEIVGGNRREG